MEMKAETLSATNRDDAFEPKATTSAFGNTELCGGSLTLPTLVSIHRPTLILNTLRRISLVSDPRARL